LEFTQINQFKIGHNIRGFFICRSKNLCSAKNGNPYIDIMLTDATGSIYGKLWDMVDYFKDKFEIGEPVAVKGIVTDFNEKKILTITKINKASENQYKKYGYNLDGLIPSIQEPINSIWKKLLRLVNSIDEPYKSISLYILDTNEEKIKTIPYELNSNPIRGSFLKRIFNLLQVAKKILPLYPNLDRDLILSGILLSNIGSVNCYEDTLPINLTEAGKLIGKTALGKDIVRESSLKIKNFPKKILIKIEHIILMHKEQITINKSMIPEAVFINNLILLDENINMF